MKTAKENTAVKFDKQRKQLINSNYSVNQMKFRRSDLKPITTTYEMQIDSTVNTFQFQVKKCVKYNNSNNNEQDLDESKSWNKRP